jgi:magnesium chelatase subunit D
VSAAKRYPFSAVVDSDDVKLALLLVAVDPAIGGVLLRGDKGTAKTTLARGLAAMLPGEAPFVDLPLGATEDRVVGTLDLQAALAGDGAVLQPGLLHDAHGGVLYVDEVNLLADHLVDVLLDVATSGVNRIEREGIAQEHPARFVLIGSMNPEEGELRPQLLDRFGLCVDVRTATDPTRRAAAVRNRMAFDADPEAFAAAWAEEERAIHERLSSCVPATVPDDVLDLITRLCASVGAQGLRADLVTARAAAALASWEGRDEATEDDVRRVAPLALAHRRRRNPFDPPSMSSDELEQALESATQSDPEPQDAAPDAEHEAGDTALPPERFEGVRRLSDATGRRTTVTGQRGRLVRDLPMGDSGGPVAIGATARATAVARAVEPETAPVLRAAVREATAGNLVVLAIDTSGSMGASKRIEAATGACLGLLVDAYQRRDRVAVVTFRGDDAQVVLRPTGSVEVARQRLASVTTGGPTPLAAGIDTALQVASSAKDEALLVVVSDGRATAAADGADPVDAAMAAADRVKRLGIPAVVVDAEEGPTQLGLARTLATAMGARYVPIASFTTADLR